MEYLLWFDRSPISIWKTLFELWWWTLSFYCRLEWFWNILSHESNAARVELFFSGWRVNRCVFFFECNSCVLFWILKSKTLFLGEPLINRESWLHEYVAPTQTFSRVWTNLWISGPLPLKLPVKKNFWKIFIGSKEPPSNFMGTLGGSFLH